jgi:hypothetical protein
VIGTLLQTEGAMATTFVMLLGALAEGFLLYVLFHFGRELRKDWRARAAMAAIPFSPAAETSDDGQPSSDGVIEIADWTFVPSHSQGRRMVS